MSHDISFYKKVLTEEEAAILEQLQEVGTLMEEEGHTRWEAKVSDIDTLRSDSSDVADRLEAYEENMALIRGFTSRLEEIKNALQKIKEGTFGHCRICGKKIEEDRLDANPAASTCKEHIDAV